MAGGTWLTERQRSELIVLLLEGQGRGLLGPGPVERHLDHARGFAEAADDEALAGPALDLGSGAGVPGLALALADGTTQWVLLDGRKRSAAFLEYAVSRLKLEGRMRVVEERAEVAARSELRGTQALVVARGVGSPSATAECAAGFLAVGGCLVVSEPPGSDGARWVAAGLDQLGMAPAAVVEAASGDCFVRVRQVRPAPDRFPRRTGQPAKRPLF